jgi:hypothetical protein
MPGVSSVQMFGERAHARLSASAADGASRLRRTLEAAGLNVTSVRPVGASLEDVFIARLSEERS